MSAIRLWLAVAFAIVAPCVCVAAPLEAYGRLPSIETAALSPDGQLIALIVTSGDARNVVVARASDHSTVTGLAAGQTKVRDLKWAGSNHLLVTISFTGAPLEVTAATKAEWFYVIDFNVATHQQKALVTPSEEVFGAIAEPPAIRVLDGKPYAFVEAEHIVEGYGRVSLFRVDVDTDSMLPPTDGAQDTTGWLVDSAGEPLAQTEYDPKTKQWVLKVMTGGAWRTAMKTTSAEDPDTMLGLGRDGQSVLLADTGEPIYAARELERDSEAWGPRFAEQDHEDFIFDPTDEHLIGTHALIGDGDLYRFFAPADQAAWRAVMKAYPGQRVQLVNLSADHRKLLVHVDSPVSGAAFALVDLDAGTADYVAAAYSDLKPNDLAPVRSIAFKAKDGLQLGGYLTLPQGRDPKNLPLVVFPHGGPAARDEPGFDWWAQAMAAQGYAVLQVNYRGSAGFGWDFQKAGFGEWGGKMQTDLSDGVRYLAAQGTIDPARVCIVGASYGGYAALAGATLDPGVYRCAVDVAGPAELRSFIAWSKDRSDISAQRYWTRYMGADGLGDPHLEAISPADHANAVSVPILIIHGKDDTVVPFEQSQMMADALKRAGKPYEFVILKHEDHWLSHGDTRLQMLQAVVDFLKLNNPAG